MEELSRKLIELEELPTQEECVTLARLLESEQTMGWYDFCDANGMYQIVHEEMLDEIYEILSGLNPSCLVEIGSGNGKLAYWLNKRGLDVKATDNNSEGITKADFVEILEHTEALQKYNPDVVLLCFPRPRSIALDILDYPSVRYLVHFGNAIHPRDEKWEEIEKRPHVRVQDLGLDIEGCVYPTCDDSVGTGFVLSHNFLYEVIRE